MCAYTQLSPDRVDELRDLMIFGAVAMIVALFARRGLWGLVDDHLHIRLFPVGYWLWGPDSNGRRGSKGPGRRGVGGRGRGGRHSEGQHS